MARLVTAGWEWGHGSGDLNTAGASAASTLAARTGTYGIRNSTCAHTHAGVLGTTYFLRFYVRRDGNPASTTTNQLVRASAGAVIVEWKWNPDGTVTLGTAGGVNLFTTGVLPLNQWVRVEVAWKIQSGASDDYAEVLFDGVSQGAGTTFSLSTTAHVDINFTPSSLGGAINGDVDDCALNDDTGTDQNSWPGEGKILLSVPISDAQDGSWVGGAGGSGIDLSTAVNNIPPVGVVSGSATNTSQIESADSSGNNATDEYRANCETYTTKGLGASDTIILVHPVANTGEDIATNSKTGSIFMQANPVGNAGTFTFGNDSGAIGTFPSNWRSFFGAPVYAPSVTLSSSPVVAIRKTDSGTRVASVDALGVYIEYVPASSPGPVFKRRPGHRFLTFR